MASVLVVDDDPDVRELIGLRLRASGHAVRDADGPHAALQQVAAAGPPDVAVLDVDMPGMDGFALLRQLRGERPDLPAVFVTGRPWAAGLAVAANGTYVAKPFTAAGLHLAVAAALLTAAPPEGRAA